MSKYTTNFKSNELANVVKEGLRLGFISYKCRKVVDELLREAYIKHHDQKALYNVAARHLMRLSEEAVKDDADLFPYAISFDVINGILMVRVRHEADIKARIVRWIPYTEENSKNYVFED